MTSEGDTLDRDIGCGILQFPLLGVRTGYIKAQSDRSVFNAGGGNEIGDLGLTAGGVGAGGLTNQLVTSCAGHHDFVLGIRLHIVEQSNTGSQGGLHGVAVGICTGDNQIAVTGAGFHPYNDLILRTGDMQAINGLDVYIVVVVNSKQSQSDYHQSNRCQFDNRAGRYSFLGTFFGHIFIFLFVILGGRGIFIGDLLVGGGVGFSNDLRLRNDGWRNGNINGIRCNCGFGQLMLDQSISLCQHLSNLDSDTLLGDGITCQIVVI